MDSKEFWEYYGHRRLDRVSVQSLTVEELYQHFAERFRRENEVRIPDSARGQMQEKSPSEPGRKD